MNLYKNYPNQKWIEAGILGTIWGSFEIIIGSFLHNIRFPLSGTVLASLTLVLLVAYAVIFGKKGIFWRAGIIAALLKSISPSAILLGPMSAIILEALLIELTLFVLGFNILGYITAGIFVLSSVIIHKILTLLVLYGFNIVRITQNLFYFITKQFEGKLSFEKALLYLLLIYVIFGIIAALIGFYTGKYAKNLKPETDFAFTNSKQDKKFNFNSNKNLSFSLIFVHVLIAVFLIWLLAKNIYIGLIVSFLYFFVITKKYKYGLKKLKKIGIWIQFLILFIVSALFFENINEQSFFSSQGIKAGIEMIDRSLIIIFSFSAISNELKNPLIKLLMFKNGFGNLYISLNVSFSAIPFVIESFDLKKFLKKPISFLATQLILTEKFAKTYIKTLKNKRIAVITGEVNSGKTTLLKKVIKILEKNNKICGFLSLSIDKDKTSFFLNDLQSGKQVLLCSKNLKSNIRTGKYFFNPEALEFGNQIIKNSKNCSFLIVDEVGILELQNKGWSEALEFTLENYRVKQIWIVRKSKLTKILRRFAITEALIFEPNENANFICEKLKYFFN